MSGRDVVCRAKTGSGKTLAFALPVVEHLLEVRGRGEGASAATFHRVLVVVPVRSCGVQSLCSS